MRLDIIITQLTEYEGSDVIVYFGDRRTRRKWIETDLSNKSITLLLRKYKITIDIDSIAGIAYIPGDENDD